ncbi:MAG TPA: dTDP-4-dehydrorhamnose reductase [Arenimonas sp.]|nr:dTDP-4-dehydrorhamnose reductase [Arenimonas sp.]
MKILLLGADGQVGFELHRAFAPLGEIIACTYSGLLPGGNACTKIDFEKPGDLERLVQHEKPDLVLNAVAHTQVDRAEDEPALSQRVNADAVAELALACKANKSKLVHYSTDYVFSGTLLRPIREDDPTAPVSVYGKTKLAGELAIREADCSHFIFRTAWLYAARGQNFLRTALKLAKERDELRIVNDQIGSPTPARWLAAATALAISKNFDASGTWHVAAEGECSWHQFAQTIYQEALSAGVLDKAPRLVGIPSNEYPTKARRPMYSRLDCSRFETDFGMRLPNWRLGLNQVLAEMV